MLGPLKSRGSPRLSSRCSSPGISGWKFSRNGGRRSAALRTESRSRCSADGDGGGADAGALGGRRDASWRAAGLSVEPPR